MRAELLRSCPGWEGRALVLKDRASRLRSYVFYKDDVFDAANFEHARDVILNGERARILTKNFAISAPKAADLFGDTLADAAIGTPTVALFGYRLRFCSQRPGPLAALEMLIIANDRLGRRRHGLGLQMGTCEDLKTDVARCRYSGGEWPTLPEGT